MIHQIFNIIIKYNYKIINLIQNNYKLNLLFVLIWILLYNYGYITENRIIIFLFVIFCICLYKICSKKIQEINFIYRANLLYIFLWIDYFKLFLINILIFMSIKIYELKFSYKNNLIINLLILMFENIFINPVKMILYKIYNVLYIWKITSIIEIFFKRIYGSILGILIFSNVIGYLCYLMNYSVLNVYILLILINCIDEILKSDKWRDYKIKEYFYFINLNKDIFKIIKLRSETSLLSLYIQKLLNISNVSYNDNKIKNFAFIINIFYFTKFKIVDHLNQIKQFKLYNHSFIFIPFYDNIVSCLNNYFRLLATLEYILIKIKSDSNILILKKFTKKDILQLNDFMLLIIKLLLYYLWDFENLGKDLDKFSFSNLKISKISTIYELEYTADKELLYKVHAINNIVLKFFDIQENRYFYEQFYLYEKIVSSYDLNNNIVMPTVILNFENYKNIEHNAIKLLDKLLIINSIYEIDIEFFRANELDNNIEQEIFEKLNEYKISFIEEWQNSKSLDIELANYKRLEDLKSFIIK